MSDGKGTLGAVRAVRAAARPLAEDDGYDDLLRDIGDARFVLLGEASHGTHEFYRERARITRRLIERHGFDGVAIEGDWPDSWQVNRYVRSAAEDAYAIDALDGFKRFPTWMWRNTDVVDFVDWQRARNEALPSDRRAGFYGLDLYSLHASMAAVLRYLDERDAEAAREVRDRYACFDRFGDDSQTYGLMTGLRGAQGCEREVLAALVDLRRRAAQARRGPADGEAAFDAEQNARVVANAEAYYRSMYWSEVSSWNLRDQHMAQTLDEIDAHLSRRGRPARLVVWAHNSHLGDARATEMGRSRGELNLGQLVRERHGGEAYLLGFSTHTGSVTAASDWGGPAQRKRVLPSRADSHERVMHDSGGERFWLPLRDARLAQALSEPRLQRAIGVIYRPETERASHYYESVLPAQFDALVHIDTTRAVEPLERSAEWDATEVPETWPHGI